MSDDVHPELHRAYEHLLTGTTAPRDTAEQVATRVRSRRRARRAGLAAAAVVLLATGGGVAVGTGSDGDVAADPSDRTTAPRERDDEPDPQPTATPGVLPDDITCAGSSGVATLDFVGAPISGPRDPATSALRFLAGPAGSGAPGEGERLVEQSGERASVTRIGVVRENGTARALLTLRGGEGWRVEQVAECSRGADDLGTPGSPASSGPLPVRASVELACPGSVAGGFSDHTPDAQGAASPVEAVRAALDDPLGAGPLKAGESLVQVEDTGPDQTELMVLRADGTARARFGLQRRSGWLIESTERCDGDDIGATPTQVTCPGNLDSFSIYSSGGPLTVAGAAAPFLEGPLGGGPPADGERVVERPTGPRNVEVVVLRADGTARTILGLHRTDGWAVDGGSRCASEPGADPAP